MDDTVTEHNCARLMLTEQEATAVVQACPPSRALPMAFTVDGAMLLCLPGTRWAVALISGIRGIDLTRLATSTGDRGVIDPKRRPRDAS